MNADMTILINRSRAYQRQIAARERLLAAALKGDSKALPVEMHYVVDFDLPFATYARGQPVTKSVNVDRAAAWFICKALTFSVTIVGTADAGGAAVQFTVGSRLRAAQLGGTISIRDSYRDRAWSDKPLPDAFFGNNSFAPRYLPRGAKLPGGTALTVTYTPTAFLPVGIGSTFALGITPTRFNVKFAFIGAQVLR